jgi:hypothetical protein
MATRSNAILRFGRVASVSSCDTSADTKAVPATMARRSTGTDVVHKVRKSTSKQEFAYTDSRSATFHGYDCTQDCSGHEAGYQWAEEQGIEDPEDCGGNSQSFIEGCQAYAEEQEHDSEDDSDREE